MPDNRRSGNTQSGQDRQAPIRCGIDEYADMATLSDGQINEPGTMEEALAITSDLAEDWKAAADLEYQSLMESETWELIRIDEADMTIVAVYVDELIILTTSEQMVKLKRCLTAQYKMKDLGKLHYCLGISIERVKGNVCGYIRSSTY